MGGICIMCRVYASCYVLCVRSDAIGFLCSMHIVCSVLVGCGVYVLAYVWYVCCSFVDLLTCV